MCLSDNVAKVIIIGAACALVGFPAVITNMTKLGYVTRIAEDLNKDVARANNLTTLIGDDWGSRSAETPVVFCNQRLSAGNGETPRIRGMRMDLTFRC